MSNQYLFASKLTTWISSTQIPLSKVWCLYLVYVKLELKPYFQWPACHQCCMPSGPQRAMAPQNFLHVAIVSFSAFGCPPYHNFMITSLVFIIFMHHMPKKLRLFSTLLTLSLPVRRASSLSYIRFEVYDYLLELWSNKLRNWDWFLLFLAGNHRENGGIREARVNLPAVVFIYSIWTSSFFPFYVL